MIPFGVDRLHRPAPLRELLREADHRRLPGQPLLGRHRLAVNDPAQALRGAVANVGTGGSWDRPPDPSSKTRLSRVATNWPTAAPSALARFSGPSGVATELMKIGTQGFAVASPKSSAEAGRAVVHVHARRDGDVHARIQHRLRAVGGDSFGHVERACLRAVIADPRGLVPMQNGGITLVEEPVVVVRREMTTSSGSYVAHELSGAGERGVDVVKEVLRRSGKVQ